MLKAAIFDFDGTLTELTLDFGQMRREVEAIAEGYASASAIRGLDGLLYTLEMIDERSRSTAKGRLSGRRPLGGAPRDGSEGSRWQGGLPVHQGRTHGPAGRRL